MKAKENELILFYNSEKQRDKEVLGYAKSVNGKQLNERDLSKTNLTERQIAEMASDLNMSIDNLIDQNEDKYKNELKKGSFSDEELLKLLVNNIELLKTPIAYFDNDAVIVKSQYSLVNKGLEIDGIKSQKGNNI